MSQAVNIVAILYGKGAEQVQRMEELMKTMCKVVISSTPVRSPAKLSKDVHEKEDYTLRYMMTEQIDEKTPDIIMIETYRDKDAAEKHTQTDHFKQLFSTMEKEGLMAKPPYLAKTVTKAGFDLDRALL